MTAIVELPEFKAYVHDASKGINDSTLQGYLTAAIQGFADATQRRLTIVDVSTVATDWRVPDDQIFDYILRIPDCISVTSVTENGGVLSATQYQLEPMNAMALNGQAQPYEQIRRLGICWYRDPWRASKITVNAKWGCTAFPPGIAQAIKVLGKELCNNQDVRFGVVGIQDAVVTGIRTNKIVRDAVYTYGRPETAGRT